MSYNNLLVSTDSKIATLTINRPSKLNALNKQTIAELSSCLDALEKDTTVNVIIITGAGDKSFVAGADISEFANFSVDEGSELSAQGHASLFNKLENLSKPVIAAVNGFALGGGLELAMAAHMRIASDNAKLGLPEVTLGVIPGYGGTQRLTKLIGKGRAMQLITSAAMIGADEAANYGLVNQVVPPAELLETCTKLASKIARNSSSAIAAAIKAINAGDEGLQAGLNSEIKEFGECFGTADFKEGTTAFLEKRKPNF